MAAFAGNLTFVGNPLDFSLVFARQPEPDLEFTEEELDQTTTTRPLSPMKPPKKRGGRPLLWIFLLILIGGAAYVAMEPEQVMDWLAPFMGDSTPKKAMSPPVAVQPSVPPEPAAVPAPSQPAMPPPSETAAVPPNQGGMPMTQASPSQPGMPSTSPAPASPSIPPMAAAPQPVAPAKIASSPLFAEGQKVTVMGNPTAPGEMVPLTLDPAGSKPGPMIRPGATLSVLDGDFQPSGWVYSVRTDDGLKGWVSEKRLRMKF